MADVNDLLCDSLDIIRFAREQGAAFNATGISGAIRLRAGCNRFFGTTAAFPGWQRYRRILYYPLQGWPSFIYIPPPTPEFCGRIVLYEGAGLQIQLDNWINPFLASLGSSMQIVEHLLSPVVTNIQASFDLSSHSLCNNVPAFPTSWSAADRYIGSTYSTSGPLMWSLNGLSIDRYYSISGGNWLIRTGASSTYPNVVLAAEERVSDRLSVVILGYQTQLPVRQNGSASQFSALFHNFSYDMRYNGDGTLV